MRKCLVVPIALSAALACGDEGPTEPSAEAFDGFRTVFPDIRGNWEVSLTFPDGTEARIVLEINLRRLPSEQIGGSAFFFGDWHLMSATDPMLDRMISYVAAPPGQTTPVPTNGVFVEMPVGRIAGDSADNPDGAFMRMLLLGPCNHAPGATPVGAMAEFEGGAGAWPGGTQVPFSAEPRLLATSVDLPLLDGACMRISDYEASVTFLPVP